MVEHILYNSFLTSEHNRLGDLHLKQNRPISVNTTKTRHGWWVKNCAFLSFLLSELYFQSLGSTFVIFHCQLLFKFLSFELDNHRAAECRERDHLHTNFSLPLRLRLGLSNSFNSISNFFLIWPVEDLCADDYIWSMAIFGLTFPADKVFFEQ